MNNVVEVKNLSFFEGKNKILDDISFDIKKGDFTTFLCNESSGKTTLCKILSGIITTDSFIKVDNCILNSKTLRGIRRKISFVSEYASNVFLGETIRDDINFYLKNKGLKKDNIENLLDKYSKPLGINKILDKPSSRISYGQKQVVAFLLAVSSNPKILILDNALSMLDQDLKKKIFLLLKQYNKKGMTILNFTNDSEDCFNGNDTILLTNGKIILKKSTKNIFDDLKVFTENGLKIPFIVELSKKLTYYKIIDSTYFDYKKLVDNIWK